MKIKVMTLGFISLLSISFSGYAQTSVPCPSIEFLNSNRNASQLNDREVGPMQGETRNGQNLSSLVKYNSFFNAQILGDIFICNYLAVFPGDTELVVWVAQLRGWRRDTAIRGAWNGNSICRGSIEKCRALR